MKVLLISDQPLAQRGLTYLLQSVESDIEVLTASNAESAVSAQSQGDDLALVIYDIDDAGRQWLDCTKAIASVHPDVALTLISSSLNDSDVVRAIEGGAMGYLSKSSPTADLQREIRGLLDGRFSAPETDFATLML